MNQRLATWSTVLTMVAVSCVLGCSKGEDIPLLAPGGGTEWPVDSGWISLTPLAANGLFFYAGVWDPTPAPGGPMLVMVGYESTIVEYHDGVWSSRGKGLGMHLTDVAWVGAGEFVAVGEDGAAAWRRDGVWQSEETGVTTDLDKIVVADDVVWAAGTNGTVVRRQDGQWTVLPSSGVDFLVGMAALHDSLFAVDYGSDIRVWDGQSWGTLSNLPWGEDMVSAVVTNGDGLLYAAADSLYVRDPAGWRSITDVDFGHPSFVRMKATGSVIWFRVEGEWSYVDPQVAPWQPAVSVPTSHSGFVPKDQDTYLTISSNGVVTWFESGRVSRDPAGDIGGIGRIALATGGLHFMTDLGVIRRDAETLTVVLDIEQIPSVGHGNFRVGCGSGPDDYYLVGGTWLYHCSNGMATLIGSWLHNRFFDSAAVGADQVLYAGDYDGLWRWQNNAWQRVLPVLPEQFAHYRVWSVGDGSLGAADWEGRYYRLQDDQWSYLATMRGDAAMLAGTDGTVFVVGSHSSTNDFPGGNVLWTLDERAGAFNTHWDQGMGPLVSLRLDGNENHAGESLIWTRNPTMVFGLDGPPANASWQVVVGPSDKRFDRLVRLADGSLLAARISGGEFFLYRP